MKKNNPFLEWIIEEKGYSYHSARTVVSRLKHILEYTGEQYLTSVSEELIDENPDFLEISPSIQEQMKRAIRYYCEYVEDNNLHYDEVDLSELGINI